MTTLQHTPPNVLGFDVGKAAIVVFDSATGETRGIDNEPAALRRFLKAFDPARTFAVCEATGGYEAALLDALCQRRIATHRADAAKVKAYIRSLGVLGKTDAIDARALAAYGSERGHRLSRWQPVDKKRRELQAMVLRRSDLVAMRVAEKNRLKAPQSRPIAKSLNAVIRCLQRQIDALDEQINALIATSPEIAQAVAVMLAMPGIGAVSAAALAALMPELGTMNRRQAAALAGLAPHPNESATRNGYRRIRGGRPQVRRVLFMVAMVAARHNTRLKTFYNRLIDNGKKPIVALTAVMRKIVVILNARIREQLVEQES